MRRHFVIGCLFLLSFSALNAQWRIQPNSLVTDWARKVNPENAWQQYPRPQLQRASWMNLNGLWDYALTEKNKPVPAKYQGKILVPFCIESALSGVKKTFLPENRLYYRREFSLPANWNGKAILLNFDAVDWEATVWINGVVVGSHKGAYDRFTFDITPYLKAGKQELVVAVADPSSAGTQARGKQQLPQQGIWYTPVSGIWQTVWLEAVEKEAWINELRVVPDIDKGVVTIIPIANRPLRPAYKVNITLLNGGNKVASAEVAANREITIPVEKARLWSPDDPFLYDLRVTLLDKEGKVLDEIDSYFGMRKISLGTLNGYQYTFLNNKPIFQYGTLDQGWWPDGLHTPPSEEAMLFDIVKTKEMGFNMIRKHIKVEPDRWYYHCDKMGMLVWQDMPSGMAVEMNGTEEKPFHLQHVGKNGPDLYRDGESAAQFEWELRRMIDLHYNFPSIVTWVPLNEGWGQYATVRLSNTVKGLDPTRLVNAVSGWALRPAGDMHDIHTYQTTVEVPPAPLDRASVIGEFGGIGYPIQGHLWNPNMRNWGYQTYQTAEELLLQYRHKFDQILDMKKNKGLSAAVYTQTTDVEGEVNGLITYDRQLIKIPVDTLRAIHSALKD
ncbi:MAG: glycoside hydrolase family 2 TIM barrel-domain containing protein [Candidatus Pseudobacter hemicellulosilyticus]|uniref:Glycoside hydrolase family 2 TIM barrel-domain containing protein n=1 Tax=Candidatus Pseudobacter hemicellulosilyticus TaxID=3121375 RepID=A0AAJ6BJW1_9BACT|nr:MAG: glycoside hydrolase family 2 TIM barrel-domain containing protein [Pseudobacter sp.]